ncbi:MAG: acyl carrier protein [Arenicella sp.]|nr:acyl carrier protein [Arenicella sp.]
MNSIENRLKDILIIDLFIELEKNKILAAHSFRNDLGIDSIGFVELKSQVEKQFSIVIHDDDFTPDNFSTISSLTELINRYGKANGVRG